MVRRRHRTANPRAPPAIVALDMSPGLRTPTESQIPNSTHLVHEIALLADQRRRAGHAFTSDALEEWHRSSLPAFTERMKTRLRNHCEDGHQAWPAKGRHARHTAEVSRQIREESFATDVAALRPTEERRQRRPRLGLVDLDTGEINDF